MTRTPTRTASHRRRAAALAAVSLSLAACGGPSSTSTNGPASAGVSAASTAPAGSPTAIGPTVPGPTSASASAVGFAVLPESVLTPVPPLTYASDPTADVQMAAQGAAPAVSRVFLGGVARTLVYKGSDVGGVQLYRFAPTVPQSGRAAYVPLMVQGFAQVVPAASTLAGQDVAIADQVRGTTTAAIGWWHGDDVVIVWATGMLAAQQIATEYIQRSASG
ncbi:MAG: hypothetical protein GC157_01215 [Frankiales bacterium]|nr:hypothetical protein [Frankiales bacterium]